MEYLARCPDSGCNGVDASTLQWFKISEAGWKWNGKEEFASETITRDRAWTFKIPTEIASGYVGSLVFTYPN
jgi:cellulase